MLGQYYLTDYMLTKEKKVALGNINLFNAWAGCGKTYFIFGEKGIIFNTSKYINYSNYNPYVKRAFPEGYNLGFNLDKVIYITDTAMLKDKTLSKYKDITRVFDKETFKRAKDDDVQSKVLEKTGRVTIMTYSTFGWIMSKPILEKLIYNNFDCIIMDEFHNLFEYKNKYDNEEKHFYSAITDNLHNIALNSLLICLSATPYYADKGIEKGEEASKMLYTKMFSESESKELIRYEDKGVSIDMKIQNRIKCMCFEKVKNHIIGNNHKILIFTQQIKTAKKYRQRLLKAGYKVECLWSINAKEKLNQRQLDLREYIIEHEEYPEDLEILIINKAYDTGWDLKDTKVQYVIIDSSNPTIITQVRNRCRHDILLLCYERYSDFGYDAKGNEIVYGDDYFTFELPQEYLNKKLTKEDKDYLIDTYAWIKNNGKCSWNTFKKDLLVCGYVTESDRGTYIHRKDQEPKPQINIPKKGSKSSMGNMEILIGWLEQEWDRKRIACKDVIDELDISRKTWDNFRENDEFIEKVKEMRIKIKTIKGAGKSLYFTSY